MFNSELEKEVNRLASEHTSMCYSMSESKREAERLKQDVKTLERKLIALMCHLGVEAKDNFLDMPYFRIEKIKK